MLQLILHLLGVINPLTLTPTLQLTITDALTLDSIHTLPPSHLPVPLLPNHPLPRPFTIAMLMMVLTASNDCGYDAHADERLLGLDSLSPVAMRELTLYLERASRSHAQTGLC